MVSKIVDIKRHRNKYQCCSGRIRRTADIVSSTDYVCGAADFPTKIKGSFAMEYNSNPLICGGWDGTHVGTAKLFKGNRSLNPFRESVT